MKKVTIISGIILLIAAFLVAIADNVYLLGSISVTDVAVRYAITGILAISGIVLISVVMINNQSS